MSIARTLLGNLPPSGHGVYARAQSAAFLSQFDFVVTRVAQGNARDRISSLRNVWLFDFPSVWRPGTNHAAIVAKYEALIDAGAVGGIADLEDGWTGATPDQIKAVTKAIADSIGRGYRWGVTTFPELTSKLAPVAASGAWFSPQLYHQPSGHADAYWYTLAESIWTARMVIPSVALWSRFFPDLATYRPWLDSLPPAPGAIGWTTDDTPDSMVRDYLAWSPSRGALPAALFWLRAYGLTPLGLGLILLTVLAILILAFRR